MSDRLQKRIRDELRKRFNPREEGWEAITGDGLNLLVKGALGTYGMLTSSNLMTELKTGDWSEYADPVNAHRMTAP